MRIDVVSTTSKKTEKIDLPKEIFEVHVNEPLLSQAVRVFLANQRKARARVKTRAEVERTKAKWFRQKGTGRARHGSRSAPIFVGGGVAHGPTGLENYKLRMPQKMKKIALTSALTVKLKEGKIIVVDDLGNLKGKTRNLQVLINKLAARGRTLLVLPKADPEVSRLAQNIPNLKVLPVFHLPVYDVLVSHKIILTSGAIRTLEVK